jgi:hypothetical protein
MDKDVGRNAGSSTETGRQNETKNSSALERNDVKEVPHVPTEVLEEIFLRLGTEDLLLRACGVCKTWRQVLNSKLTIYCLLQFTLWARKLQLRRYRTLYCSFLRPPPPPPVCKIRCLLLPTKQQNELDLDPTKIT